MASFNGTSLKPLSSKKLNYKIFKYSSSSSTYLPENILEDNPGDQSSRWSTEANTPPQFVILKLEKPSIVTKITFGKYEKTHSCNLKHFKVYGMAISNQEENGQEPDFANDNNTLLLIDSGLKNDTVPETFRLKHVVHDHYLPVNYVKITPLECWKPSFNFSIWYVSLEGDDTSEMVQNSLAWHDQYRQREAIRLCLKHFRQHNYTDAFEYLQQKTRIRLEDPLLTELHHTVVRKGDYEASEEIVTKAIEGGLFDKWMDGQLPIPEWTPLILPDEILCEELSPTSPTPTEDGGGGVAGPGPGGRNNNNDVVDDQNLEVMTSESEDSNKSSALSSPSSSNAPAIPSHPGCRGGHQMVINSDNQVLYLFGGWDGNRDLADFWAFDISSGKWRLLSLNTEADGGPSPRSCHKMIFDPKTRQIFILGRYLERGLRDRAQNIKSDFYKYEVDRNKWTKITEDTSKDGGPMLIFDHQMCIDSDKSKIYVFGGQSLVISLSDVPVSSSEKMYSGLYEYHIPSNTWTKRRDDVGQVPTSGSGQATSGFRHELKSRSSHSMLFHKELRKLFIFGGQRKGSEYLNDFFSYNVDTDEMEMISTGTCPESAIPAVGHTQRATINQNRHEIHVMTGLNRDTDKSERKNDTKVTNSFWVYNILTDKWTCFYRNENNSSIYWNKMQTEEPRPRYAHQLVYDEVNCVHFMFGGNPGGKQGKEDKLRLGDFWRLQLIRPSRKDVLRRCKLMIRQCNFSELASNNQMQALKYLHTSLASIVDHKNPKEEREYQLLTSELFRSPSGTANLMLSACTKRASNKRSREGSPLHQQTNSTINATTDDRTYQIRSGLFDKLAAHFPDELTHPRGSLIDLIPYSASLSNENSLATQ